MNSGGQESRRRKAERIRFALAVPISALLALALIMGLIVVCNTYPLPGRHLDEVQGHYMSWERTLQGLGTTYSPQWVPDGRHIVFMSKDTGTTYIVDIEGRELIAFGKKRTRRGFDNSHAPELSPDGTKVLYSTTSFLKASERRGAGWNFEIATANLEGKDARRLTENSFNQLMPTWSPREDQIAYVRRNPDYDYRQEIVVISSDGQGPEKLAVRLRGNELHGKPFWSLDGSRLGYMTKRHYIYSVGVNGEEPLRVFTPHMDQRTGGETEKVWVTPFYVRSLPAQSPVSDEVAFIAEGRGENGGGGLTQIYLVNMATGDTRTILLEARIPRSFDGIPYEITWGPEGETILMGIMPGLTNWANNLTSSEQVFLVNLESGKSTHLGGGRYASWSPEKKRIAIVHSLEDMGIGEKAPYLTITDPLGRNVQTLVLQDRNGSLTLANAAN